MDSDVDAAADRQLLLKEEEKNDVAKRLRALQSRQEGRIIAAAPPSDRDAFFQLSRVLKTKFDLDPSNDNTPTDQPSLLSVLDDESAAAATGSSETVPPTTERKELDAAEDDRDEYEDAAADNREAEQLLAELDELELEAQQTREWDEARRTVRRKRLFCYVFALIQLVVECVLVLPGMFLLVDFVTGGLGATASLLWLLFCCVEDLAVFYVVLFNLLAILLEPISAVYFLRLGFSRSEPISVAFHLFPVLQADWRQMIALGALDCGVILLRCVAVVLAYRYRNAVRSMTEYFRQRLPKPHIDHSRSSSAAVSPASSSSSISSRQPLLLSASVNRIDVQ